MFVLKLAAITCLFYFAIGLLIEGARLGLTYRKGVGVYFRSWTGIAGGAAFFGVIWLGSFLWAFRIAYPKIWTGLVG